MTGGGIEYGSWRKDSIGGVSGGIDIAASAGYHWHWWRYRDSRDIEG